MMSKKLYIFEPRRLISEDTNDRFIPKEFTIDEGQAALDHLTTMSHVYICIVEVWGAENVATHHGIWHHYIIPINDLLEVLAENFTEFRGNRQQTTRIKR